MSDHPLLRRRAVIDQRDRDEVQHDLSKRAVAWVERSCAEQGVPVKLSDPVALRRIAEILGEARDAREAARKGSRAA